MTDYGRSNAACVRLRRRSPISRLLPVRFARSLGSFLAVLTLCFSTLAADEGTTGADVPEQTGLGTLTVHDHAPIRIHSSPVVERLGVRVIEPVDLCVSDSGSICVADAGARCVFRVLKDGRVELAAKDMDGIRRIAIDGDDNLFILTATEGSGNIFQITPAGYSVQLHTIAFRPAGFTRDRIGGFVVASAVDGRCVSVGSDGSQQELARLSETAVDIELNSADQPHALLPSGKVILLGLDGTSRTVGFAPAGSRRLLQLPEGRLAVLHAEADQRPVIRMLADEVRDVAPVFAQVPFGTTSVGFDSLGNLCLANPDLRAVTKVTSRFVVPCPHCGRSLKMIFSTEKVETETAARRAF